MLSYQFVLILKLSFHHQFYLFPGHPEIRKHILNYSKIRNLKSAVRATHKEWYLKDDSMECIKAFSLQYWQRRIQAYSGFSPGGGVKICPRCKDFFGVSPPPWIAKTNLKQGLYSEN